MAKRNQTRRVTEPLNKSWYDLDHEEMGGEVRRLVASYKTLQSGRRETYTRNLEMYEKRALGGYSAHAYCEESGGSSYTRERLGLVRSSVSSAVSSIYAPQKPKPQFQTNGATWGMRRKAYKLDKICEGILNQRQGRFINMWAFMQDAGVDCALQGVAAIYVYADKARKRIGHELFPSICLHTDPVEGRNPQNLFGDRPISVDEAITRYAKGNGKLARLIESAPAYQWLNKGQAERARAVKTVEIDYAWKLPEGSDKPGKYCASINGETLDSDDWTAPAFPFVFLVWEPHRDGFWGAGLGDEGGHMSAECDELDMRLWMREVIASGTKWFYEEGSVNPNDLTVNDALVGIPYTKGSPPPQQTQVVPFNPMELEFQKLKIQAFWDAIGISQVSAAARREQGVSSGVAIRTLNDTKSGRQLSKAQRFEQSFVDLGHQYVWRLRELAEEDKNFAVRWPGKNLLREVMVGDAIDIEDEDFAITVAPASALPHDPAGRQEMVQDLYKGGLISQETAKQLMGWPDLDSELEVENAETEYIDMLIERYLDAEQKTWNAGEYQAPEGFILNKVGAIRRFASAYFRARIDQAALPTPKEKAHAEFCIALLTRYIREMDALMQPPAPPPAPPGAPGPMPPGPPGSPMPGAPPPMMGPVPLQNQQLPAPMPGPMQ